MINIPDTIMQKNCAKYNIGVTKVSKELSKIAEQNEIAAAESNDRIMIEYCVD